MRSARRRSGPIRSEHPHIYADLHQRGASGTAAAVTAGINQAILFGRDRYDADRKTVTATGGATAGWVNIACATTALAKLFLVRHTEASQTGTDNPRGAAGDAQDVHRRCLRRGTSFTVHGQPLYWEDAKGITRFPDRLGASKRCGTRTGHVDARGAWISADQSGTLRTAAACTPPRTGMSARHFLDSGRLQWPFLLAVDASHSRPPRCRGAIDRRESSTRPARLIYIDGGESYLVPHATRTALNSLGLPEEAVRLRAAERRDGAAAGPRRFRQRRRLVGAPRSPCRVQIAPLSVAFETIAANERMNTIMNHELVHVATMDQAARSDRMFRRLFGGKVLPVAEQPESILYFYLTAPRVAAPRWYHEGIAVFVDTWMAGGIGRAQGGYDEMVFRSMVRDNAPFYNPLGLVSKGTKIDFQVEINSYLYGTRFMTWLARRYSPERLIDWVVAPRRQPGLLRGAVQAGVRRRRSKRRGRSGSPTSRTFQRRTWRRSASIRSPPYRDVTGARSGSVSRAYYDPATKQIYAAFNYPGVVAHIGAIDIETRRRRAHHDDQGTGHLQRDVAGLGSGRARAVLHDRQRLVSRSGAARPGHRPHARAAEGRAHRRHRLQPGRPGRSGASGI